MRAVVGKGWACMDAVASAWTVDDAIPVQTAYSARSDSPPNVVPDRIRAAEVPKRVHAHGSRTAKLAVIGADAVAIAVAMVAAAVVRQTALHTPEGVTPIVVTVALYL